MALWRFIRILFVTLLIFIIFNFLLSNFNANTLGYKISFHFDIPPFLYLESLEFPVGLLLIGAFCLGMLTAALTGSLSMFYRNKELKSKNRIIRELESELADLRSHLNREHYVAPEQKIQSELNRLPNQPNVE